MNPEMERRIQEARAAGYTEEEIQAELAIIQGTAPAPQVEPQTPIDRSEEYTGLAQGMGTEGALTAAKIAGLGAAGAYGLKKAADIMRGPVAPPQPTTPGATQRILSQALGSPTTVAAPAAPAAPAAQGPSVVQRGMDYARQMQRIAAEKVMSNAGNLAKMGVGLGALTYSGGLNAGEEEELRRRRAMAPTITR